jgi:hypothetical protein
MNCNKKLLEKGGEKRGKNLKKENSELRGQKGRDPKMLSYFYILLS